jgi:hypothetical protein
MRYSTFGEMQIKRKVRYCFLYLLYNVQCWGYGTYRSPLAFLEEKLSPLT